MGHVGQTCSSFSIVSLSESSRRTLDAVCDAFVPRYEGDGRPLFRAGALDLGVPVRVAQLIDQLPDPADRAKLHLLLHALGSRVASLVGVGRFSRFHRLPQKDRERVLTSWATSSRQLPRTGFQALKRLVHVAYYCWPGADGSHPAWETVGYPGPLPQPKQGVTPLAAHTVDRDTAIDCDVVIVGSGAGGGVVAGVLAESGRDVIVLEQGPNPGAEDMTQIEGEMLESLYLDGGLMMTQSGSMPVLAGSCVGGGTVVNYTTSFELPDATKEEWNQVSGLEVFSGSSVGDSFKRVSGRIGVNTDSVPGTRDQLLEGALKSLGWHVDALPRNVTGCLGGAECGFCGYGCRHGVKNSTATTYLRDAVANGARVYPHCTANRVVIDRGRATGVEATVSAGSSRHALTVRARRVVIACGAIYTPAVLARSGVSNPNVGRNLHLHPATAMIGVFDDRIEPWTGSLQTRYSDEFADLDSGFGVKFETAPVHFALASSGFGWGGSRAHREDVARLAHTGLIGILLRDRDAGHVRVTRGGRPRVHYTLSAYDAAHARTGVQRAAEVLAEAGAREIVSLHSPPARERVAPGWGQKLHSTMDTRGYSRCRMSYVSFHQMGTAAMGRDARTSVVDDEGRSHEIKGLYVADGSVFPTSSGVNPMLTIMAIADHVGRSMAEQW